MLAVAASRRDAAPTASATRETDGWIHQAGHEHHRFPSPFSRYNDAITLPLGRCWQRHTLVRPYCPAANADAGARGQETSGISRRRLRPRGPVRAGGFLQIDPAAVLAAARSKYAGS